MYKEQLALATRPMSFLHARMHTVALCVVITCRICNTLQELSLSPIKNMSNKNLTFCKVQKFFNEATLSICYCCMSAVLNCWLWSSSLSYNHSQTNLVAICKSGVGGMMSFTFFPAWKWNSSQILEPFICHILPQSTNSLSRKIVVTICSQGQHSLFYNLHAHWTKYRTRSNHLNDSN